MILVLLLSRKTKDFHFYSLGQIEDIFVATNSYLNHLSLRENSSDIFSTANIMLLDKENVSRKYIEDYFKARQIEPKHILEVGNMDLLIEFAKTSLGVACVIKKFVEKELADGTLVQIPLTVPIKKEVGFCYVKSTFLSDSMKKFIDFIKAFS